MRGDRFDFAGGGGLVGGQEPDDPQPEQGGHLHPRLQGAPPVEFRSTHNADVVLQNMLIKDSIAAIEKARLFSKTTTKTKT